MKMINCTAKRVSVHRFVNDNEEQRPIQYLREKYAVNSPLACTVRTFRWQSADWLVVRVSSSSAAAVSCHYDPQSALKSRDQSVPNAEAGEIGRDG